MNKYQEKLEEYREINRLQAQIIHESQQKKVPCREYRNADIEYIEWLENKLENAHERVEKLAMALDKAGIFFEIVEEEDWK